MHSMYKSGPLSGELDKHDVMTYLLTLPAVPANCYNLLLNPEGKKRWRMGSNCCPSPFPFAKKTNLPPDRLPEKRVAVCALENRPIGHHWSGSGKLGNLHVIFGTNSNLPTTIWNSVTLVLKIIIDFRRPLRWVETNFDLMQCMLCLVYSNEFRNRQGQVPMSTGLRKKYLPVWIFAVKPKVPTNKNKPPAPNNLPFW